MAEAAIVSSVLGKLAEILTGAATGALLNKLQKLQGVSEQIELMQEEFRLIQALLRDADSKRNTSELVAEWLKQVTEIANRIASAIDTFRDKIEEIEENRAETSESSKCTCFRKIKKTVKRNYKTYKLGLHKELEDIIGKLNRILQRGNELGIQDKLDALDDVDDLEPSDNVPDPEVVGFEDDMVKIIEQLLDRSISRLTVLSIVGTGGLGKTTLAQKVYKRCMSYIFSTDVFIWSV
jgi:disease resistance protein RPM1